MGNRKTRTRLGSTTSYGYDRADRVTTPYTVNPNGNLTGRPNATNPAQSDAFVYDQTNRLTSITIGGTTTTYTYDGDGKRTSQTVGTTTTSYVYDVAVSLPVLLDDGTRKYVWGAGGLASGVDKTSGAVQVYHTDGLGSVRSLTDSTGTVVQTYQADEFGIPARSVGWSTQPFGYTGEQVDPTGLVYLRARIYDPQTGRFLQRDIPHARASPTSRAGTTSRTL